VSPAALEQLLRDLPSHGKIIKDRGYRQVWRFEMDGRGYFLKFYPRRLRLKRILGGNPATWEFIRLQALQRADVPAPRATAQLLGFRLNGRLGDAVVLEAIEPSVSMDQYVMDFMLRGERVPNHLEFARQIRQIVAKLGKAKLGHEDLHLGNFLLKDGQLFLLDGYSVSFGGITMQNMFQLTHSLRSLATRTDLQRGWDELGPGGRMPMQNPVSQRQWRKFMERSRGENDYFGKLQDGGWSGVFFKQYKYPRRWAPASRMKFTSEDWQTAWPLLWRQIESDQLEILKRSPSGDVLGGEMILGGRPVPIVVKRSFKRYWYRYLNEIGRGSRAWRAWKKSWALVVRDIPTAWPLLVMQKRSLGYITDSVIVSERLPGPTLAAVDLDAMPAEARDMLFRRTGKILRQIEDLGMFYYDAKSSNWIVQEDEKLGPRPVLIDVDGIRFRRWPVVGIQRLLRSMREHRQYTPADSLALCQGYAPFSPMMMEQPNEA